jgi:hypothetical protein
MGRIGFWTWAVLAALVASRLAIFFAAPHQRDLGPYPLWANKYHQARNSGEDFYSHHQRRHLEEQAKARRAGKELHDEGEAIEYPPLALAAVLLPALPLDVPEGDALPPETLRTYILAYRLEMLAWDLATFALVALLVLRLYPQESPFARACRLMLYLLGTALMGHLLYMRLDIALAALLMAALYLLVVRVHYVWPLLLLALGIHFKLVPVVLLPVFVLGALPADWPQRGAGLVRALLPLAGRALVATVLVAALAVPFLALYGTRPYGFLGYHGARGLEIESNGALVLMTLYLLGQPLTVEERFGSHNVTGPAAPLLLQLSTLLLALLVGGAALWLGWKLLRRPREENGVSSFFDPTAPQESRKNELTPFSLAQTYPGLFVNFTLLTLLVAVATSKVFSPQYIFWIIPLVAVAPLPRWRGVAVVTLVICALTTVVYPILFWKHLVGLWDDKVEPLVLVGPTVLGVAGLAVRNLVMAGLAGYVAVAAAAECRALGAKPQAKTTPAPPPAIASGSH